MVEDFKIAPSEVEQSFRFELTETDSLGDAKMPEKEVVEPGTEKKGMEPADGQGG